MLYPEIENAIFFSKIEHRKWEGGFEMSCTEQRFGRGERLKSITIQRQKRKKKRPAVFYSNYPSKITL